MENHTNNGESCSKESCAGCPSAATCSSAKPESLLKAPGQFTHVRKVIAVVSGKGGVGKSFVTASLASLLRRRGYEVGIMDADITGPSIPKMFGVHGPAKGDENGIYPMMAKDETRIMSVNLLMENEEEPVIWRGPVISNMVTQFWTDVVWGKLDYLFIDMPPGTGDVPLTVFQSLPIEGVIVVTSPQDLVQMIVKKAYHMAQKMEVPVLGIVENYSYLECPDCGKHIHLFGESKVDAAAAGLGLEVLAKLPLNPELAKLADAGKFHEVENAHLDRAVELLEGIL